MDQAPQAIIMQKVIENDFKVRKQRLTSLQKKIDEKKLKFMNEKKPISQEKRNKLKNMEDGMHALERECQTDYMIRQQEATNKFFKLVREQIKNIAKEKKYLIVI